MKHLPILPVLSFLALVFMSPELAFSADETAAKKQAEKKAADDKALAQEIKTKADLEALGQRLKAAVDNGEMSVKEAVTTYQKAAAAAGIKPEGKGKGKGAGKGKGRGKGNNDSFYAIIIGRLRSKDIELGEFSMEVDYVTSIYGDRKLKDTIIGKRVKVVGVSGPWLDKLLLMKRGQTLKLRSGTLTGTTISLSPKATVLERAEPFDPATYPVPPEEFRGFQGVLTGKIESKSDQGYDLTLRVSKVEQTLDGNQARKPESIVGRLMDMQGFYNGQYRETFDDLRIGDTIRVGAAHRVPETDVLEVIQELKKVE